MRYPDLASASAIGAANIRPQQSGLEKYLADLNVSVGDEASIREGPMVEIRVAVADVTVARRRLRPGRRSFTVVGPLPIAGVP